MQFFVKQRAMNTIFIPFTRKTKLHKFVMMLSHQGQSLALRNLNV